MTLSVAIVGSGPAGFYTADALFRADPACRIDILDRLPTPYGLIRFGVAPDHEKTKNVMRGFARTASDERVNFYGDVDIGDALSLDELRGMYDAVVLAVGAAHDRPLGLPGEDKAGVVGSASFVNWYNAHLKDSETRPDIFLDGKDFQKRARDAGYPNLRGNNPDHMADHWLSYSHDSNLGFFVSFLVARFLSKN